MPLSLNSASDFIGRHQNITVALISNQNITDSPAYQV